MTTTSASGSASASARDAKAVHVRGQCTHGIDLDHRDAAAEPVAPRAQRPCRPSRSRRRRTRGRPRARSSTRGSRSSVVWPVPYGLSNMCLQRASFAAIAGKRSLPVGLERTQPCDAGRRLLADTAQPRVQLGPVLGHPARQLEPVVDHELGAGRGDREQIRGELVRGDAVPRMYLDAALDERGADGILGRERVDCPPRPPRRRPRAARARGTPSSPRGARRPRACGPRSAPSASRSASSRCRTGMCCAAHSMRRWPSGASDGSAMRGQRVARAGLEPATPRFSAVCSTN